MTMSRIAVDIVGPVDRVEAPRRHRVPRVTFWRNVVSPWPALLVLVAGILATLLVYAMLSGWRNSENLRTTSLVANGVRRVVEARVNDQLGALGQLAVVWSGNATPEGLTWKRDSTVFLQQHPGITLLAWMEAEKGDPEMGRDSARLVRSGEETHRLIVVSPGARDRLESVSPTEELAAGRAAARTGGTGTLVGPFEVDTGDRLCEVSVPLGTIAGRENHDDLLVALFDPTVMLGELLADMAPRDRIRITNERGTLHAQQPEGEAAAGAATWDVVGQPVRLVTGATWKLDLTRSGQLLEAGAPAMETAVLATGLAISVLLAVIVYLGQVARVRAQALAHTNRELQARVRETVAAQERFRALNTELEARVADRTRALDAVVSDLETFNYSISHDLRTPLGAITNFVELLNEDCAAALDRTGRDMLQRISRCAGMAVSMMDGLLAFSRVGRQELLPSRVDMRALVLSALADVSAGRPDPPPELVVGELPDVQADASMMRVVWTNLLSNAIKYTAQRPDARIDVDAHSNDEEHVFLVRDNGIGFDMREADRLFGVFERLHADNRAVAVGAHGHGVGLAIVRRVVTRHGGRVWAQSAPGKGATFYFSIPRSA